VLFELDPVLDRTDQSVADVDGLVGANATASEPVSEEEALGGNVDEIELDPNSGGASLEEARNEDADVMEPLDVDAKMWMAAGVVDWATYDAWMPPALFQEPYVYGFETEDLEHYMVTRGWPCDSELDRSDLLTIIRKRLSVETKPEGWSLKTRKTGRMNLRKKPKKSAKVGAKRQRTEETASGLETPPAKSTEIRKQQSPVDLTLEAKATPVNGVVVSAMQDAARLAVAL
jgi:hypothetical protein